MLSFFSSSDFVAISFQECVIPIKQTARRIFLDFDDGTALYGILIDWLPVILHWISILLQRFKESYHHESMEICKSLNVYKLLDRKAIRLAE
nr:AlNc14C128G6890 [Albugo laibachii Nc14]|eukprot:CCA21641.1 AlNc14C128G6890 [Albugo laibachii Nc14]